MFPQEHWTKNYAFQRCGLLLTKTTGVVMVDLGSQERPRKISTVFHKERCANYQRAFDRVFLMEHCGNLPLILRASLAIDIRLIANIPQF
jgi:hypothetical protein